jgi:hypothetical protein
MRSSYIGEYTHLHELIFFAPPIRVLHFQTHIVR